MPAIILPTALDPDTLQLVLTPGTYSSLVQDTWGAYDPETDPSLALTDSVAVQVSAMGDDPIGANDTAATLGGVAGQITQGNGAKNAAALAPVATAIGQSVNDYLALVPAQVTPSNPTQPPTTQPTTPTPTAPCPGTWQGQAIKYSVDMGSLQLSNGDGQETLYALTDDPNKLGMIGVELLSGDPNVWYFQWPTGQVVANPSGPQWYTPDQSASTPWVSVYARATVPGTYIAIIALLYDAEGDMDIMCVSVEYST